MRSALEQLGTIATQMVGDAAALIGFDRAKDILSEALPARRKILVVGNGASAGEAQRFALAFVTKFTKEHEAYPAISLASDAQLLTAIANDYGFAEEFKRQVEALGEAGDVLVALSVSGNSENVLRAIDVAKARGMRTISLCGKGGGKMRGTCDAEIIVPSDDGARIQEVHLLILDALCAELDALFK